MVQATCKTESPLNGPGRFFVVCRQNDTGKTIKNLRVGEEIHIILNEDQYQWKEWHIKSALQSMFRLCSCGNFVGDTANPRYGSREFVFEIVGSGSAAIQFEEVQRTWSWFDGAASPSASAVAGAESWQVSFEVL